MSTQDDAFENVQAALVPRPGYVIIYKSADELAAEFPPKPKECSEFGHVYKEYVGLTERYNYCARCDKKRSWEESEAAREAEKQRNDNWDNVWKTYRP